MKRIGKMWVAALAVASLTLAARSSLAADPIVFGYIDDLSGLVAEAGNDSLNGVKVAVEEYNATAAAKTRPIKLVVYDGKVDAQLTSTLATRAIEDDKAVAIFGGNVSGSVPGVIALANDMKVPFFSMSAAADNFTSPSTPYFFRFGPSNSQDAAAVANLIAQSGFKRVGIINVSLPFGLDGASAITAALKTRGINVVTNQVYEVNATDVSPQVLKTREANPDVIVVWPYPADGGRVLRTMAQQNIKTPTIIARVALFDTFRQLAGEAANGVLVPNTVDTQRADVKAMLAKFAKAHGERPPTMYIAMGYDGAKAAIKALADRKVVAALDANNLAAARVALRDAVETGGSVGSLQGSAGNTLKFSPGNHQALQGDKLFVWAQVQGGKLIKADLKAFAAKK